MSVTHSVTAYWITLSTPRRLQEKKKSYRWQLNYLCDIITDNLISTKHFSDNQENGWFGLKMTNVTHVCSTASSASALSSLTEPVRSEFLQMFPVKRGGQVTTMQILHGCSSIVASLQVFEEGLECEGSLTCSMTTCLPW